MAIFAVNPFGSCARPLFTAPKWQNTPYGALFEIIDRYREKYPYSTNATAIRRQRVTHVPLKIGNRKDFDRVQTALATSLRLRRQMFTVLEKVSLALEDGLVATQPAENDSSRFGSLMATAPVLFPLIVNRFFHIGFGRLDW